MIGILILAWDVVDWRISILVVQTRDCSLGGLHWYRVGMLLEFQLNIPVDVTRAKSYVNNLFNSLHVRTNAGLDQ